jgi:3-deoxy-D-manno-octulosonate 8-phosphate phosphatase (KDO 8-P phosphatase)
MENKFNEIDKLKNSTLTKDLLRTIRLIAFDFDGVFTDNSVYVNQDGIEEVRCFRSDGIGLSRLKEIDVLIFIVSTEINPVVSRRAEKLKVPCMQGVQNKAEAIIEISKKMNIDRAQIMFVGNDINDIPAFKSVGIPVGVLDSYPEIYPYIVYRTQRAGGFGAVREICDLVFNAKS